ncbi:hypothetical protein BC827DRAFT_653010 [Russula dissimulans]|nr:hypothetical protein BC827DRAFT_653010 [Russula dissimulans]
MSDSNLEAFYAELDARMALPDDESLTDPPEHRRDTSGSEHLFATSNNDLVVRDELPSPLPTLSKRKAPLSGSGNRGKGQTSSTVPVDGREAANISATASAPASMQDMTSLIEDFTDVTAESPAAKRDGNAKRGTFVEETSTITTPGNTPRTGARARSEASVVRPRSSVTATAKQSAGRKKGAKAKPELVTPAEFARRLQEQAANPPPQYLKDCVIFYTGGDLTYASARTRGCMNYIHRHGGTVLPTFDPATTTHIITEANEKNTLRALGLKALSEIPLEIPTVNWSWVLSGKPIPGERDRQQMDYEFMHAAFPSRMDAGRPFTGAGKGGKGKRKPDVRASQGPVTGAPQPGETSPRAAPSDSSSSRESSPGIGAEVPGVPFEQPALELRKGIDAQVAGPGRRKFRSPSRESSPQEAQDGPRKKLRGFICDDPTATSAANSAPCVNQDIVDKLSELAELHRVKPTQDDKWRVLGYTKAIAALRRCKERITSVEQAMSLNGVGEKTALKIMEIIDTGALRRLDAERTEDVVAVQLFQGIYGVGQSTAYAWYLAGCRTLEDIKQRKGGIQLSQVQAIGLRYYDDINTRIPREEAAEIFREIKSIALALDPKIFIEIMGSYRRGKSTCGDIDVMISRSTADGKTHAGIVPKLLSELHSAGIVTEDLSLSSDASDNLECTYRGLCIRPGRAKAGQDTQPRIQRRIDILAIPWKSRGAALLYYTGDDIFNRSMRLKANKMGYSLNQRGLFADVVRSTEDRTVKTNAGECPLSDSLLGPLAFPRPRSSSHQRPCQREIVRGWSVLGLLIDWAWLWTVAASATGCKNPRVCQVPPYDRDVTQAWAHGRLCGSPLLRVSNSRLWRSLGAGDLRISSLGACRENGLVS